MPGLGVGIWSLMSSCIHAGPSCCPLVQPQGLLWATAPCALFVPLLGAFLSSHSFRMWETLPGCLGSTFLGAPHSHLVLLVFPSLTSPQEGWRLLRFVTDPLWSQSLHTLPVSQSPPPQGLDISKVKLSWSPFWFLPLPQPRESLIFLGIETMYSFSYSLPKSRISFLSLFCYVFLPLE